MKTINFLFKILPMMALLFTINTTDTIAQKGKTVQKKDQSVLTSKDRVALTNCDDYITRTAATMDKKAAKSCNTQKRTITCKHAKSGKAVDVVLISQPKGKGCPNVVKVRNSVAERPQSRGGGTSTSPDFKVDIIQTTCSRGGVTLDAYIPGDDENPDKQDGEPDEAQDYESKDERFDFTWLTSGEVFDTDQKAECVTGDKITLKVMDTATGQMVIKSVTVQRTPAGGDMANKSRGGERSADYKIFGMEKTACFGTCPVYKVSLHKNGTATWKGIANVEKMGDWTAEIDEEALQNLKEAANRANYYDMAYKYPEQGQVADASSTVTYVRMGDTEKFVKNTLGAPDALLMFEDALSGEISRLDWKPVKTRETGAATDH